MPMFPLGDNNAPGSPSNPFPSYEALVAAPPASWEMPWVANPLAPEGKTQACLCSDQGIWVPRPGQCIAQYRGANGALLVDMTAAGRTPGTWYQVWSGAPIIPDWLLPLYRSVGVQARLDLKEASNAGSSATCIGLRGDSSPIGDPNNSIIARQTVGSQYGSGILTAPVYTERRSGSFFGSGGLALSGQGDRPNSSFSASQTRPVLDVNFGLVTNTLKLWYVSLWSGA